jgi:RNA polymerase sigma-70 factor, ECF subfamily
LAKLFSVDNVQFVLRTMLRLGAPARDAEDLAQEVLVIAHRRASEFDATRPAVAWLFGIAKNVILDYRRRACHRHEVIGVDGGEHPIPPGISEDVDLLRRAIATLPEILSDVIILCDLSGLTVLGAATALGVAEGTLKDRLRRARRDLRAVIDRQREEVARG